MAAVTEAVAGAISSFLMELEILMEMGKTEGDFSALYARHPLVRIGIRRAMVIVRFRQASRR